MKKQYYYLFLLIFLLFVIPSFYSCAVNPVTGEPELMLITEEQELRIGKEMAPSASWEFGGHYYDPRLKSYLEGVVRSLWSVSERSHLPFEFHIENSSIPNAFALPGYVAITRGLLCALKNEAQFAAVIGHEIGHVMARHTAQRISRMTLRDIGLTLGAVALQNTRGREVFLTLGSIGSTLLLLKYDRQQELQADRLGVLYMARAGYNPYEALRAHELLQKAVDDYMKRTGIKRGDDSLLSNLLSTHPREEVRISEIRQMIENLPPHEIKGNATYPVLFMKATKNIREVHEIYVNYYDPAEIQYKKGNYEKAERLLRKAIFLNDSQAPFYNLLGFVKLQQKKYKEAERLFNKALDIDHRYQPSLYGMGLYKYFTEEYESAIQYFEESIKLYPQHYPSYFGVGKSYFNLDRFASAIPYFEKFAKNYPRHPEVHGLLGICYERTGDIISAIREYKIQLRIDPHSSLGRYAKSRLIALGVLKR